MGKEGKEGGSPSSATDGAAGWREAGAEGRVIALYCQTQKLLQLEDMLCRGVENLNVSKGCIGCNYIK